MARPKKSTVDYFPHDTNHGATIQVLESRWGNDGYAFWFKLLELLGSHDHHYIDCRKPAEWEFLTAKTRVNEETATAILESLCRLDAIDAYLWSHCRVIFCENFVVRVEDAYKKRRDSLPTKKTVYSSLNVLLEGFPVPETLCVGVSGTGSTERERESKVNQNLNLPSANAREVPATVLPVVDKVKDGLEEGKSKAEVVFERCWDENAGKIRTMFPALDYVVERAKCVAYHRNRAPPIDPLLAVLRWCESAGKSGKLRTGGPLSASMRRQLATFQAAREFCGDT